MCDNMNCGSETIGSSLKTIPVHESVGMVLAHDITEIRKGEFKGRAFKKGHLVKEEDIDQLMRLGKDHLFVLTLNDDELHEDEAALRIATALSGEGVVFESEPKEGKINLIAKYNGLLKIDKERLMSCNMHDDIMCATLHNNTVVKEGQVVAGTRAIPLVVKRSVIEKAEEFLKPSLSTKAVIEVKRLKKPRAGIVVTGNEVYYGRIQDAFAPIVRSKIEQYGGEVLGLYYAPDDVDQIEQRLRELIEAGADLLITTGGMSVDPDDVTRFAIKRLGAADVTYGSAVLPGAMFLVAYISAEVRQSDSAAATPALNSNTPSPIAVLGIPACGMYHKTTIFDIVFPRVLAGEKIGRKQLAELGHGGLCLNCKECRYPICPFGK